MQSELLLLLSIFCFLKITVRKDFIGQLNSASELV